MNSVGPIQPKATRLAVDAYITPAARRMRDLHLHIFATVKRVPAFRMARTLSRRLPRVHRTIQDAIRVNNNAIQLPCRLHPACEVIATHIDVPAYRLIGRTYRERWNKRHVIADDDPHGGSIRSEPRTDPFGLHLPSVGGSLDAR